MRVFTRASLVLALSSAAIFAPAVASAHSRPHHPWRARWRRLRQRQHRDREYRRGVSPPRRRFAAAAARLAVRHGRRGNRRGHRFAGLPADRVRRSLRACRRRRFRPDLGAGRRPGRIAAPRSRWQPSAPAAASRSASQSTTTSSTWPTPVPVPGRRTTPASCWAPTACCTRCPGRRSRCPDGSQPGDVLFNATGSKLAATRVGTSLIDSFVVGHDGRLQEASGAPYAAQGARSVRQRVPPDRSRVSCMSQMPTAGLETGRSRPSATRGTGH